jgi:hypothetical protein
MPGRATLSDGLVRELPGPDPLYAPPDIVVDRVGKILANRLASVLTVAPGTDVAR